MDATTHEIVENWRTMEKCWLAKNKTVWIDYDALDEAIAKYPVMPTPGLPTKWPGIYPDDDLVDANRMIVGNVWEYAFKDPALPEGTYTVRNPDSQKKPYQGFLALWGKLYGHFGENYIMAADLTPHVANLDRIIEFFRDINDIPLPELRLEGGRDLVSGLQKYYDGNPLNVLEEATHNGQLWAYHDGNGLVELITKRFPLAYGKDVHDFEELRFKFNKRARLLCTTLHSRASASPGPLPPFADIEDVGPIIDYQIPRLLRHLGVLRFTEWVDAHIESQKEIASNTPLYVFIRAAAFVICYEWSVRTNTPIWKLDPHLFSLSRGLPNKPYYSRTSDA